MRDPLRHFTAEFIGTFALVFVGGGAIVAMRDAGALGLVVVALAHGLILALMVTATMRISGHLNPAVTLGFLAVRRIEPVMAGLYIIAQILGATIAALALKGLVPADQFVAVHGTIQEIASNVSWGQAFALEAIATFFLQFVIFGTAVDPRAPQVGGFAIGLTVAADILAIGPLTGASMNPARSFGPAFVTHSFGGQFVYWTGPIVGAIVAAVVYDAVLLRGRREVEPVDHGEVDTRVP
jgi:MIP family channel proteins